MTYTFIDRQRPFECGTCGYPSLRPDGHAPFCDHRAPSAQSAVPAPTRRGVVELRSAGSARPDVSGAYGKCPPRNAPSGASRRADPTNDNERRNA